MTPPAPIPTVVGRLAPSPTGYLHLGHARSFLIAWWHARRAGGRIQLRLEDLDRQRSQQIFTDAALEDLAWLGLTWDGPVVLQSQHLETYRAAIADLEAQGRLFACVCSRKDIQNAINAPHGAEGPLYPGTCRGRFRSRAHAESETKSSAALRFLAPDEVLQFSDQLRGRQSCDVRRQLGDFVVARRDGAPAYHLSVVVDDARYGITHVVRGDDLLESTGCQLLLSRALGYPLPEWIHLPLVVDSSGKRLAKRHDALSLRALRAAGVPSGALVAWVARSVGMSTPREVRAGELIGLFDVARLPTQAVAAPADAAALLSTLAQPTP